MWTICDTKMGLTAKKRSNFGWFGFGNPIWASFTAMGWQEKFHLASLVLQHSKRSDAALLTFIHSWGTKQPKPQGCHDGVGENHRLRIFSHRSYYYRGRRPENTLAMDAWPFGGSSHLSCLWRFGVPQPRSLGDNKDHHEPLMGMIRPKVPTPRGLCLLDCCQYSGVFASANGARFARKTNTFAPNSGSVAWSGHGLATYNDDDNRHDDNDDNDNIITTHGNNNNDL